MEKPVPGTKGEVFQKKKDLAKGWTKITSSKDTIVTETVSNLSLESALKKIQCRCHLKTLRGKDVAHHSHHKKNTLRKRKSMKKVRDRR